MRPTHIPMRPYQSTVWVVLPLVIGLLGLAVGAQAAQKSPAGKGPLPGQPGDLVTLNIENADIAEILKFLSLERQVNIVAGKEVTGKVSINLYNVPFETALSVILQTNGFAYHRQDNVIFVTKATESPRLGLQVAPITVRAFQLNYASPTDAFDMVQTLLSPKGKAVLGKQGKTLLVQDTSETVDKIAEILQTLDARPRQVLIEAKILEVALDDATTLGIDWNAFFGSASTATGGVGGGNRLGNVLTQGFATNPASAAAGVFFSVLDKDIVGVVISALREHGRLNTLASPKILAVHGQEAKIIIGSKLGFRVTTTTETVTVESVQFLEVGTQLLITPSISDDGYILMHLRPKVSDGKVEAGLPSEKTTEATTTVLVRDGATIIIAGLLNERQEERNSGVPGLASMPLLGGLFRRSQVNKSKTEIAVLITPHIVREAATPAAAAPEPSEPRYGETMWDTDFVLALSNAL